MTIRMTHTDGMVINISTIHSYQHDKEVVTLGFKNGTEEIPWKLISKIEVI